MHGSPPSDLARTGPGREVDPSVRPVLVFDGSCGGCARAARWLAAHADGRAIDLVASAELTADQLDHLGIPRDAVMTAVWWVDAGGPLSAHRAISAALGTCRSGWSALGRLIDAAPLRWIAPSIYRQVARHRHLLPGATRACRSGPERVRAIPGSDARA